MNFNRPTLTQIDARIRGDLDTGLPGADSRLRFSVLDVLAGMLAGASHGWHGHADWIARQILPDTAEAEMLARHAAIWGVTRKPAQAASGPVTISGSDGAAVSAGDVLIRSDGARFVVTAGAVIAAGTGTLTVEAEAGGAGGTALAGQKLTFSSPVAGVLAEAAVAAGGLTGGAEEESDASLLARLLSRIQTPPHGGTAKDYKDWALAQPEVTRAWVIPGWMGPGSVGVTFTMDARPAIIPLEADVDAVQAAIDAVRPVTATAHVFAPSPVPLALTIRALPPTPEVQAAIAAELADLIFREAQPGGTLLISHIREAISIASGETDHEVIAPVANVAVAAHELLVPGVIAWV